MARLAHDNLDKVYEVGEHAGRPYYAMHFVGGTTVNDLIQPGPHEPGQTDSALRGSTPRNVPRSETPESVRAKRPSMPALGSPKGVPRLRIPRAGTPGTGGRPAARAVNHPRPGHRGLRSARPTRRESPARLPRRRAGAGPPAAGRPVRPVPRGVATAAG